MKDKKLKGQEYLYYGVYDVHNKIVIKDPNDTFPDKYYSPKDEVYTKVTEKTEQITKAAYTKHSNGSMYSYERRYKKVYRTENRGASLEYALRYANEKMKKSELKVIIETAKECLIENEKEMNVIRTDRRYTEEYKEELLVKYVKENEYIESRIVDCENYLNNKEDKKRINKLNKAKREVKRLEKDRWKMSDVYYEELVDNIIAQYPEFSKEEILN